MLTPEEMKVLDRNAEWMGIKILDLMENAGRAVAETALRKLAAKGKRVLVVCGTGNNGGDGLTAARYLKGDADVTVLLAKSPSAITTSEALTNYERVKEAVSVVADEEAADRMRGADVIIDALLGTGVQGSVRDPYATLIRAMNDSGKPILSVDVPSGLGEDVAVKPSVTVALHDVKAGMTEANSGTIQVESIGIPSEVERTIGPGEFVYYPRPRRESHKGDNGRLLVVGGGPFTGAPAFVGLAAYGIGADVVHVAAPASASGAIAAFSPNLIVHPLRGNSLVREDVQAIFDIASGMDAVAIGPGLGTSGATAEAVREILQGLAVPVVIDADALPALRGHLDVLAGRAGVLTPHHREFEVVSGQPLPEDSGRREEGARAFAKKLGMTVLLKGAVDVVTDGDRLKVNKAGNPGMTVGGTGDVLAGLVGGLLAKRVAPYEAARIAAFASGYAGDLAFEDLSYGFTAQDVVDRVPQVLKKFL